MYLFGRESIVFPSYPNPSALLLIFSSFEMFAHQYSIKFMSSLLF